MNPLPNNLTPGILLDDTQRLEVFDHFTFRYTVENQAFWDRLRLRDKRQPRCLLCNAAHIKAGKLKAGERTFDKFAARYHTEHKAIMTDEQWLAAHSFWISPTGHLRPGREPVERELHGEQKDAA